MILIEQWSYHQVHLCGIVVAFIHLERSMRNHCPRVDRTPDQVTRFSGVPN